MRTAPMLKNGDYSLVFEPPIAEIEYVKSLKEKLESKIGWYHSCNSFAHITIASFKVNEKKSLDKIIPYLSEIAPYEMEIPVRFNSVDSFVNGVVYLKPDKKSEELLKVSMSRINKQLKFKFNFQFEFSSTPHLTIARGLNHDQVQLALNLFKQVSILEFSCNCFTLRTLGSQQFVSIQKFPFLGWPPKPPDQLSLAL